MVEKVFEVVFHYFKDIVTLDLAEVCNLNMAHFLSLSFFRESPELKLQFVIVNVEDLADLDDPLAHLEVAARNEALVNLLLFFVH